MDKLHSEVLTIDRIARRPELIERALSARVVSAAVAILLGTAILFAAGFSSNDFVHAAAHDVRHASGFPCH
jgi:cobalt transporter subunit CbtB